MRLRSLLIPMLLFVGACSTTGSKDYIEPDDPFGQQCASECRQVRTQCRARAQDGYRQCKQEYDYRERQHAYCVAQGGTFCIQPERCKPARTEHCQNQYEGCFLQCGGRIERPEQTD